MHKFKLKAAWQEGMTTKENIPYGYKSTSHPQP